jgi:protein MpaA
MPRGVRWSDLLVVALLLSGVLLVDQTTAEAAGAAPASDRHSSAGTAAVRAVRVFGHSSSGRPLRAYRLGPRTAHVTVVALAAMHGDETGGSIVLRSLRDGAPVRGVALWVVPRVNPDGVRRHDRHNARGVDLNRNFPVRWQFRRGYYASGPRPSSEPETRGLQRLLNRIRPDYVVSFHSPLHGVDTYRSKDPAFARRLSRQLGLPLTSFDCDGGCHGTLTQWFNARHRGACVTVELGPNPSARYLRVRAPQGLLHAIGGRREKSRESSQGDDVGVRAHHQAWVRART